MATRLIIALLIGLSFASCDKLKQTEKRIEGNWTIVSYNYVNFQGFTTEFEGSGEFNISDVSSAIGNYSISLAYQNAITSGTKIESGMIKINDNAENYTLERVNSDGSITSLDSGTIKFLNKTQMETFFNDELGSHHFVLSKD